MTAVRHRMAGQVYPGEFAVGEPEGLAAAIAKWTGGALKPADYHVRRAVMANDLPSVDRALRVTAVALTQLAPMAAEWQPLLRNHNTWMSEDLPVARLFEVATQAGEGCTELAGAFCFPRGAKGDALALDIDSGMWREVSIAAWFASQTCSICGKSARDYCEHAMGKEYDGRLATIDLSDPNAFDELSFAWKGRLQGTRTFAREEQRDDAVDSLALMAVARQARSEHWYERREASFWP